MAFLELYNYSLTRQRNTCLYIYNQGISVVSKNQSLEWKWDNIIFRKWHIG